MPRERPKRTTPSKHDRAGVRTKQAQTDQRFPGFVARAARFLVGSNRHLTVAGVRYKERDSTGLDRALSSRGKGTKSFEVRFPRGRPMIINVTKTRRYADLMAIPAMGSLVRAKRFIKPGQRVLVLGSGTGAIAELIAGWTGPHGAVVALEHDHESVRYARRRYALPSTSLERGGAELLAGEIDGSFDAVIVDQTWVHSCGQPAQAWDELWRVLAESGNVVHLSGGQGTPADAPKIPDSTPVRGEPIETPAGGPALVVLSRIPGDAPDAPGS